MRALIACTAVVAGLLAAAPVMAQTKYSGSITSGRDVGGSTACPTYGMKIDLSVMGSAVTGSFQQTGRDQRNFSATADAAGNFRTDAIVGGGGKMRVTGTVRPNDANVKLDGYCIFDVKLTKR